MIRKARSHLIRLDSELDVIAVPGCSRQLENLAGERGAKADQLLSSSAGTDDGGVGDWAGQ